jgi:hypothetical protein
MLAPRNKLWSTPLEVVNLAITALKINESGTSRKHVVNAHYDVIYKDINHYYM